jgi:hypothetical protein
MPLRAMRLFIHYHSLPLTRPRAPHHSLSPAHIRLPKKVQTFLQSYIKCFVDEYQFERIFFT